ncbi:MAG TPA: hypothetical protein VGI39_40570 [Polyangiaceae bacterium]
MKKLALAAALSILAASTAACVQSPTTGTTLSSQYETTTFTGYAVTASAPVNILAWNYRTSTWDTVATTTSSPTVSIPQNTAGQNPALYAWSVPVTLASQSNPNTYYWDGAGSASLNACDYARVKVTAGGWNALTFDSNGASCVQKEINQGENATNAALDCKSSTNEVDLHWTSSPCIF